MGFLPLEGFPHKIVFLVFFNRYLITNDSRIEEQTRLITKDGSIEEQTHYLPSF